MLFKQLNKGDKSGMEEGVRGEEGGGGEGMGGEVILGRDCWIWKRTNPKKKIKIKINK